MPVSRMYSSARLVTERAYWPKRRFSGDICLKMADWGVAVKYHHHEVGGPGQLEVEVEPESLTEMADKTMVTKYIIKNVSAHPRPAW